MTSDKPSMRLSQLLDMSVVQRLAEANYNATGMPIGHRRVRRLDPRRLRLAGHLRPLPPRGPPLARALPRERRLHQAAPLHRLRVRVHLQERAARHRRTDRRRGRAPRDAFPRPVLLRGRAEEPGVLRPAGGGARVRQARLPRRARSRSRPRSPRGREHRRVRPRARPVHRRSRGGRASARAGSAGSPGERGAVPDARRQHGAARVDRRRARPHALVQQAVVRLHGPAAHRARWDGVELRPPRSPRARPREDHALLPDRGPVGGHVPDQGEGRLLSLVPVAFAPDPRRRREGHPLVRDQHRRHGAAPGGGGAARAGSAQGRVHERALARAAESPRPHPQLHPPPRARGRRERAGAPGQGRHPAADRAPREARGRPPRRDPHREGQDRAVPRAAGRRERRAAERRGPALGHRRARPRAHARPPQRAGPRRRGRDPPRTGAREPPAERGEVHAERRERDRVGARRRGLGGDPRARHGRGHRARHARSRLRAVLPGRRFARADRQRAGARARAREDDRGAPRRHRAGRGEGAEIVVRLPLATGAVTHAAADGATARAAQRRRVLVVDDNVDAADSLAELVQLFGHSTEVAYDGPTALAKAQANPPDVVLCDIGLPGMSGYDVARALRAGPTNGMRLVAVSGYAQPEDVERAAEAGFDHHVAKPPDPDAIERLLA